MKLFGSAASPYARKARLVLLEKGIPHEYVLDAPREPGSLVSRLNPLGRIPTLLLDDGTVVYDSPVICDCVDLLSDTPVLIPRQDPAARLRVKRWEALADGVMDSTVAMRVESLRPAEKQDPATLVVHGNALGRALAHAAEQLEGRAFCEGAALTLADLALVSALLYLDLRQPERDWRRQHPALLAWSGPMLARPSVSSTL